MRNMRNIFKHTQTYYNTMRTNTGKKLNKKYETLWVRGAEARGGAGGLRRAEPTGPWPANLNGLQPRGPNVPCLA